VVTPFTCTINLQIEKVDLLSVRSHFEAHLTLGSWFSQYIDKFKSRLVAKGYTKKEGIDYFDTYSPVTRLTTIRILVDIASIYKLIIHQMDVKTAF
jgi:hypothetical protein